MCLAPPYRLSSPLFYYGTPRAATQSLVACRTTALPTLTAPPHSLTLLPLYPTILVMALAMAGSQALTDSVLPTPGPHPATAHSCGMWPAPGPHPATAHSCGMWPAPGPHPATAHSCGKWLAPGLHPAALAHCSGRGARFCCSPLPAVLQPERRGWWGGQGGGRQLR